MEQYIFEDIKNIVNLDEVRQSSISINKFKDEGYSVNENPSSSYYSSKCQKSISYLQLETSIRKYPENLEFADSNKQDDEEWLPKPRGTLVESSQKLIEETNSCFKSNENNTCDGNKENDTIIVPVKNKTNMINLCIKSIEVIPKGFESSISVLAVEDSNEKREYDSPPPKLKGICKSRQPLRKEPKKRKRPKKISEDLTKDVNNKLCVEEVFDESHEDTCQNKEISFTPMKKESNKKSLSAKKVKHKKYEKPSDQIVKLYQCTQCPRVFQRASNFNAHQRKHNNLKNKPFSCQDCMSTFSYRFQLVQHERIHTGERPFQCHSCSKTFARKGCLVAHMVTHTDSMPYQCEVCNRRFARKYNLSKHLESHSTDRPHCCLECSRRFKCKQSLEKHLRIHQLSIYACTICHQSFDTKRRLTNHTLNEHVSYRPFTCQICNKPFIFKSQLTYHIKEHDLERPYSCTHCKKSYFKKGHLLSHIKQYCSNFIDDTQVKLEDLA